MVSSNEKYSKVYDFTNENVGCLKDIYHFDKSNVLSIVGSGDQYFTSILNGSKSVDLFDINPTSYLYLLLKFYAIRELSYEEFYNFFINKNITNKQIYNKLEPVLPKEVLEYYKYLILNRRKMKLQRHCFREDGIPIKTKFNKIYYFNPKNPIIPYLIKDNYYKLQDKLKSISIPKFYCCDLRNLKQELNKKYDIMLLSNIYSLIRIGVQNYTNLLKSFDVPEIEAEYDWHGNYLDIFKNNGYESNIVKPSSPIEYNHEYNLIYTLRR